MKKFILTEKQKLIDIILSLQEQLIDSDQIVYTLKELKSCEVYQLEYIKETKSLVLSLES
jgi:hypothetical protein